MLLLFSIIVLILAVFFGRTVGHRDELGKSPVGIGETNSTLTPRETETIYRAVGSSML